MPELPEVQTVINVLKEKLIGKKILDYKIIYEKMIENISDFNLLKNKEIKDIKRIGKFICFLFDDIILISHLRMEGKYFIKGFEEINFHEHVIFYFSDFTLRYHDVRKFGIMCIRNYDNYLITPPLKNVADDPFMISINDLKNGLKKNKHIKTLLLDQGIISGIGNIYADEILYKSNINPFKLGIDLTEQDIENIKKYSCIILNESIKDGGTTIRSYTSSLGVKGNHQDKLLVHTKRFCPLNHLIKKERINGRSSYYCPICQK